MPRSKSESAFRCKAHLLLSSSLAITVAAGYGRSAYGGSCTATGPGTYECSGAASPGDATVSISTGATPLAVTTQAGFGHTVSAGSAFTLEASSGLAFTDGNAATISGADRGISATNNSAGALTITTTGDVSGGTGAGIFARNSGTELTISAASVSSTDQDAINAQNTGTGSMSVTATGAVTSTNRFGLFARNYGTDLNISAADVSGGQIGILTRNRGSGALTLTTTGAVSGGSSDGIIAFNHGTGMTITTAAVSGGVNGIFAQNEGTGALSISSTGTVSGTSTDGIYARNTAAGTDLTISAVDVSGGDQGVFAENLGSGALTITTTGTAAGTAGSGIFARNSGTDLTITAATVTSTDQDAINAQNSGSGSLSVTATGAVTSTNRFGLFARNYGTDLSVSATDVSGGQIGILARNRGTGALSVTTTGAVSGGTSDGIIALNDGTDLTVTTGDVAGAEDGIDARNYGSGVLSVTTSGAVRGGTGAGIATQGNTGATTLITLNAGSDVSSTSGVAITNDADDATVTVNTGAVVSGAIQLGDGSDLLNFAGGDFSGVTSFDGGDDSSSGDGFVDTLRFASSGAINGASVTNFERFEVVSGGVLTLSDNTLAVGDGSSGTGIFTQAGGILQLNSGATTLTGNVSNGGALSTQNGAAGDIVTIDGDFTGGGSVLLDVSLGDDSSAADMLVVSGDASGTTLVSINNVGGAGAQTINGIEIIQVNGTSTGSFTLDGDTVNGNGEQIVTAGPFGYRLVQTTTGTHALSSLDSAGNPILAGAGVASYEALPTVLMSLNRLQGFQSRTRARVPVAPAEETVTRLTRQFGTSGNVLSYPDSPLWFEISGTRSDIVPVSSDAGITGIDTDAYRISVGADTILSDAANGTLYGGLSVFYGDASSTVTTGTASGNVDTDSLGLNLSATWLDTRGFYVDTQLQYARNSSDASDPSTGLSQNDIESDEISASVEVGRPIEVKPGLVLIPQAQLAYSTLSVDEFTGSSGNQVTFDDADSLTARLGVSANKWFSTNSGTGTYFGLINLYQEFDPETRVTVGGFDFNERVDDTGIELGFGARMLLNDKYEVSGSLNYLTGLENVGDSYALEATLGLQIRF